MRGRVCVCCTVFGIGATLVSRSVLASSALLLSMHSRRTSEDGCALFLRLLDALSSIIAKDAGDRIPVWEATWCGAVRANVPVPRGDSGGSGAALGARHA